jgi:amino acid permease
LDLYVLTMDCCFVVFGVLCYSEIGFVFFIIFKVIVIETLTHLFLVLFTGGTLQQSRGSDFKFPEAVKAPHGSNIFVSSADGIEDADLYD